MTNLTKVLLTKHAKSSTKSVESEMQLVIEKKEVEELISLAASQHRSGTGKGLVGQEGTLYIAKRQKPSFVFVE
eukprot:snap_masked-scaffold_10-processed-gene-13.31-mRNA-1 protein AED:1.00 eAED:1.00 QI:0/-1/0/0/-1/1/1/0/73